MKPLTNIDNFLKRFNNFKDGEFRSIDINSPSSITLTLAAQDNAREFDWISVKIELTGVSDAKVLQNEKLHLIDMSDGISIINENEKLAFGIGECYNISSIKNSICYIECSNIKYEEGLF